MKKGYLFYLVLVAALVYFLGPPLFQHIKLLFSSEALIYVIQGRWDVALIYIIMFSAFLLFLNTHPIKKVSWRSHSIYAAFIIALFAEMFGFPLTVFFLSSFMKLPSVSAIPIITYSSTFMGMNYQLELNTFLGLVVSVFSLFLVMLGWKKIYKSKELVTDGIYSIIRHPQYLGIMLIITTWALVWPTILLLIMWPILIFSYYKLAKREEKEMSKLFGTKYESYKEKVPMLLPFFNL